MSRKAVNIKGMRFGRLVVLRRVSNLRELARWECQCDCGKKKKIIGVFLRCGASKSCGCLAVERAKETKTYDHTGKRFGMLVVLRRADRKGRPYWECRCDCGNQTTVAAHNLRTGNISSCGCLLHRKGDKSPSWKGGRYPNGNGYITVQVLDRGQWRKVLEHRYLMEKKIGRRLLPNENVHHKNGDRQDNRIKNLELWVKTQPCGQRVEDLVKFSLEVLERYAPEKLQGKRSAPRSL